MIDSAKAIYDVLNTPGGLVILFLIVGVLGWRGYWRWDREVRERDATIEHLRMLVNRLTGAAEANAEATNVVANAVRYRVTSE